jgi:tetratricopeptide (TPR) repeat protein
MRLAYRLIGDPGEDIEEPFQIMSDLAKRRPKDTRILFGLGRAAESVGRYSAAADAFKRVVDLEPKNLAALNALAAIYGMARLLPLAKEQLEVVRGLGDRSPGNADLWSKCMVVEKRWADAWEGLDQLFLTNPTIQEPYENLPEIAIRTGQEKRAEELLERRIGLASQYSLLQVRAAYCRLLLHTGTKDKIARARDEMERANALETGTGMPVYFVLLARARLMDGDPPAALEALGRAAGMEFEAPVAYDAAQLLRDPRMPEARAAKLREKFSKLARLQAKVLATQKAAEGPGASLGAGRDWVDALEESGQIAEAANAAVGLSKAQGATEADRATASRLTAEALRAIDTR